jgi:hypothetical protein
MNYPARNPRIKDRFVIITHAAVYERHIISLGAAHRLRYTFTHSATGCGGRKCTWGSGASANLFPQILRTRVAKKVNFSREKNFLAALGSLYCGGAL